MMIRQMLSNEKGIALITVYCATAFITALSAGAYGRAFWEARHVDMEVNRIRSYAAAEAGLQSAMTQISQNAFTGFINTAAISRPNFSSAQGTAVGSFNVNILYPDQADWVVVTTTATVNNEIRNLEARIFLDSNLSKYLVYANTSNFSSGDNAQYGTHNGSDPEGTAANADDRTMMYFTGDWTASGSNVQMYGDVLAQGNITGSNSSGIHGDSYVQAFTQTNAGTVTNSGVTGGLQIGDGFGDDTDRNNDGVINQNDYADRHDLTADGEDDSRAIETITPMNLTFYANNNNTPALSSTTSSKYLKFEPVAGGSNTRVIQYSSSNYSTVVATYNLPQNAIVYVKGDAYVKGEIKGRVSIAASDDIMLTGNLTYANGQTQANAYQSAALLAKDILYFQANDLTNSGILYAENSSNAASAYDATYNTAGQSDPNAKSRLRLNGNRIIKGGTNLSYYQDRVYGYDPNLKYYRPPGIPVLPDLRTVRET